ncbi:hypothetical protein DMUE_4321 [Dictyocoela muelleri]|nr:hypothetical protein DMUE_4321 [Dictyocoela muelleri]
MFKYQNKQIFTAQQIPTGNSIIEKINREITIALRNREKNHKITSSKIWKRLNLCSNSTLGFSPFEVFFQKSMFDCHNEEMNIKDNEILNKMKNKQDVFNK